MKPQWMIELDEGRGDMAVNVALQLASIQTAGNLGRSEGTAERCAWSPVQRSFVGKLIPLFSLGQPENLPPEFEGAVDLAIRQVGAMTRSQAFELLSSGNTKHPQYKQWCRAIPDALAYIKSL